MDTQYALLGFLEPSPNYGYKLKLLYDQYFGQNKPILSGQIYSTLSRMTRDNKIKIEKEENIKSGGPKRVKYSITDIGLQNFNSWLTSPEEPNSNLQATLYIKTILSLLRGDQTNLFLDKQKHFHIEKMRELTKKRGESNLANRLLIDHAIFHLEADIRWMELTASRINEMKLELLQSKN